MSRLRVALVSCDPAVRLAAAKVFDAAPAAWSVRLCEVPPPGADVVVVGPDVAGEVAGLRFDPADPHRVLAEIRAAEQGRRTAAAVTGACGGAGATTIALHVAAALGACLVDLSPDTAAAQRLGIDEVRTFAEGDDVRYASVPVAPGFRLLAAPGEPAAVGAALGEFERVVVDCAGTPVPDGMHASVVVLLPSVVAARRARRVLAEERAPRGAVVVNRTGPGGTATRLSLERALGRRVGLTLPCTAALRDAEDEGRLLTSPHVRWWRRVRRLAHALENG